MARRKRPRESDEESAVSSDPQPSPHANENELNLLYSEGFANGYRNYKVQSRLLDNIKEAQELLNKSAILLEGIRVLYSDEEKINELEDISEHFQPDSAKEEQLAKYVQGLDRVFKSTLEASLKTRLLKKAVIDAVNYADQNKVPRDITIDLQNVDEMSQARPLDEVFDESYQSYITQSSLQPQSEKFGEKTMSQAYSTFRQSIFNVNHGADEEMRAIETYYDDYDEDENDLVESRAVISYKCPLTKKYFEDPVTSKRCGHSFSKAAIMEVIEGQTGQNGSNSVKCPVSACQHYITARDFREDPDLAAKARARQQRDLKQSQRRDDGIETL